MTELERAVEQLREAIKREGPHSHFHQQTMARHRLEWPTLWKAIDRVLDAAPITKKVAAL